MQISSLKLSLLFLLGGTLACSSSKEAYTPERYDQLIEYGLDAMQRQEINEAIEFFQQARKMNEDRVDGWYYIGYAYAKHCFYERYDCRKARKYLDQAIAIDEQYEMPYLAKTLCYMSQQRNEEALEAINTQLNIKPNNPDALRQRAYVYLLTGDTTSACGDVRKLITLKEVIPADLADSCP